MAGEGLFAHAVANVPQFGGGVAGAGDERLEIGRQRQRHYVPRVPRERRALLPRLDVPQCAKNTEEYKYKMDLILDICSKTTTVFNWVQIFFAPLNIVLSIQTNWCPMWIVLP